jgi:LPPG:FO 2-phospho-L-lactate transferase
MTLQVTVLNGGIGGAKFLQGVEAFAEQGMRASNTEVRIRAIVNTADDFWLSGLRVCPDLDSVMYALAGVNDTERGWGRANESERVQAEITAYGAGWDWFTLGDLDIATHIVRTGWLREGHTLTEVTRRLTDRWPINSTILPMTDAEVETHVLLDDGRASMHLEGWWVKHRARLRATGFVYSGAENARATDAVLRAIADADVVLIAPSNPVVSVRPILAISEVTNALHNTAARIIGVSPIIGDAPVRGMAKECLDAVGAECSAVGVASYYGARNDGGLLDGWVVGAEDSASVERVTELGIDCLSTNLWMRDSATTAELVRQALTLGEVRHIS